MVNHIDLHSLNLEELNGVVNIYPWYAAARKELCVRMQEMGALSDSMISQTALHIGSRRMLYDLVHTRPRPESVAQDSRIRRPETDEAAGLSEKQAKQIFVVGGDYFSPSQYSVVRKSDDNIFSSFATKARQDGYVEPEGGSSEEFCTETLAQIYLEQGYLAEAKKIYSKLSLRYPEKSVYFATLIDEIDKNN